MLSVINSNSYPVSLYSDEYDYLVIEDLVAGNKYNITLSYSTFMYSFDAGFSVYSKNNYRESNLIFTQDENGTDFEFAVLDATQDGNYYVKVWINDVHGLDDSGSLDLDVIEQGTGFEMDISSDFNLFRELRVMWIILSVVGGIAIISFVVIFSILSIAAKKHRLKVADALEKGIALPRHGPKKNKCPFCNLKLPPESLVQCPYCGAPIQDE